MQNKAMSKPKPDLSFIEHNFKEGSQVEISSYDKEFLGSWYNGTVIHLNRKSFTAVVEYSSRKDERKPLLEKVDLVQLRPLQLLQDGRNFAVNEYVDMFFHDGWWEGMVTDTEAYGEKKKVVFVFKHTRKLRAVKVSKLRPHHEWVFGKWHPELDEEEPDESTEVEVPVMKKRGVAKEVPLKSPKVRECKIRSREVEVCWPSSRKHKTQLQEVEEPKHSFSKRKTQSRKVEVPAFEKRKFQLPEIEVPSFEKRKIQWRKLEVPVFKKPNIQSRDVLYSPSKEVQLIPDPDLQIVPLSSGMPLSARYTPLKEQCLRGFNPGQLIELSNDDEGFEGAWLPATVIQPLNGNKYLIKYEHILADDEKSNLVEMVDGEYMRPSPPAVPRFGRFVYLEDIDAFYNDCWWAGAITKVLIDDEYIVYFGDSKETMKFRHSQLRIHQKWINGQWVLPPKALQL